eukprot:358860-Chlamydomonas_euryale.AAC.2
MPPPSMPASLAPSALQHPWWPPPTHTPPPHQAASKAAKGEKDVDAVCKIEEFVAEALELYRKQQSSKVRVLRGCCTGRCAGCCAVVAWGAALGVARARVRPRPRSSPQALTRRLNASLLPGWQQSWYATCTPDARLVPPLVRHLQACRQAGTSFVTPPSRLLPGWQPATVFFTHMGGAWGAPARPYVLTHTHTHTHTQTNLPPSFPPTSTPVPPHRRRLTSHATCTSRCCQGLRRWLPTRTTTKRRRVRCTSGTSECSRRVPRCAGARAARMIASLTRKEPLSAAPAPSPPR